MKNNLLSRLLSIVVCVWLMIAITSCGSIKGLQYVQGSFDTTKLSQIQVPEPIIQKGDLLGILVYSDDAAGTAAATTPQTDINSTTGRSSVIDNSGTVTNNVAASTGYIVDQQGYIQLFKLGSVLAAGKTKKQLSDSLAYLYTKLNQLLNPYVEVRFMNFKVTLIGEISKPGTYTIPSDRISAFEAIGLAGDITMYGRRDNVLVVRETNGKREFGKLDFSKPDVFLSPYYYLQQNDMIIVDVAKNKAALTDQTTVRNISIATSALSIIAIFIGIFRR